MPSYNPTFQDRVASAEQANQKALEKLKSKPAADPALAAEQRKAWEDKQQALAEERAAKQAARETAKAEKAAAKAAELAAAAAAAELKAARLKPANAAEMKAARDARYAARKARNS